MTYRVDGRWGHEIGHHSAITYETVADGGMGDASWTVHLEPDSFPRGLRERAFAEAFAHGERVWHGRIQEIDRETGGVRGRGTWADGETIPAIDGTGASTRSIATAIATARVLGWKVNPSNLTGTVDGDPSEPVSVVKLLTWWGEQEGKRVGVDARGNIYARADPVEPRWVITSNDVQFSATDLGAPNALAGRYINTSGVLSTTRVYGDGYAPPVVMETIDLTERGMLTEAKAASILSAMLRLTDAPVRWTNSLTLHRSQIQNRHGVSPSTFNRLTAGHRARIMSLSAAQQRQIGAPYLDVTLGSVVPTGGSDFVELAPVGVTPQSLEEAMEAVA